MIDWFIDLAVSGSLADGLQRVDWFIDSALYRCDECQTLHDGSTH